MATEFVRRTGIDIATATELTARTIALAVGRYPDTREVIVSGGGAHNGILDGAHRRAGAREGHDFG